MILDRRLSSVSPNWEINDHFDLYKFNFTRQMVLLLGSTGIIGFLLGYLSKVFIDWKERRGALFEARKEAYSSSIARIFNLFQEPDINQLPEELKFVRVGEVLSESVLLGSPELTDLLGEYKGKVLSFHSALEADHGERQKELHKELVELSGKIYTQMRRDLNLE